MAVGKRIYGKCDQLEDGAYVGTMFLFFVYFPLIPMHSMLVTSKSGRTYHGVDVPLSWRSVGLAYFRACAWAFFIGTAFVAAVSLQILLGVADGGDVSTTTYAIVFAGTALGAAISAVTLFFSYRVTRASPERAAELRSLIGPRGPC